MKIRINYDARVESEEVDNAWDAEAKKIKITLPDPCTNTPIIIEDDGTGMTLAELQSAYCFVANNRRKRGGELGKAIPIPQKYQYTSL